MDKISGRSPILVVAVVLVAGVVFYLLQGGSSGTDDPGAVRKPHDAFEMTVASVQQDGSLRGRVEPSGRYADDGLAVIGTDDRVRLRLADVESLEPVREPCWAEEAREATREVVGTRIWVDADSVREDRRGGFEVHAWNRDDVLVQEQLVRDGDLALLGGRLGVRYDEALRDAEDAAVAAGRGLWGACPTS